MFEVLLALALWALVVLGFLTCLYFAAWAGLAIAFRIIANRYRRQGYFVVEKYRVAHIGFEVLSADGHATGHGRVRVFRIRKES